MKVAFRADASIKIGIGHVMRCLSLADALSERGIECHFLCRDHPGNLIAKILGRGHFAHTLGFAETIDEAVHKGYSSSGGLNSGHAEWLGCTTKQDVYDCTPILQVLQPDWLIVDHYALDASWERPLKQFCSKLMVIDDLADREHDCDLLLDQSFGRSKNDYQTLVADSTRMLLGPRYALLRPEFPALRIFSAEHRRQPTLRRLLVCMGGIDRENASGQILEVLSSCPLPSQLCIEVILGENAPAIEKVRAQALAMPWPTEVAVNVTDMAARMARADLAIGAAGSTSWERCALGLPAIVMTTANNQSGIAQALSRAGAHWYVGQFGDPALKAMAAAVCHASLARDALTSLSEAAAAICDGNGVGRVLKALYAPQVVLRPACLNDAKRLHTWRNDPQVRHHFFDPRPIAWDEHIRWIGSVLKQKNCLLLIATADNRDVGSVRIDLNGDDAEVSIYLAPEEMGCGTGPAVIQAAVSHNSPFLEKVKRFSARILPENVASRRAFEAAGFSVDNLFLVRKREVQ